MVVATGGQPYEPREHLYGQDERVWTQVELSRRLAETLLGRRVETGGDDPVRRFAQ